MKKIPLLQIEKKKNVGELENKKISQNYSHENLLE
jgi:hypothetical protein